MCKRHVLIGVTACSLVFAGPAAAHHPPVYIPPDPGAGEPDRTGFCDKNNRYWDLVEGQQDQEPWTALELRYANVGLLGNPAATWC